MERVGRGLYPFEGGLVVYFIAVLVGLVLAEVATLITTIYLHRVLSHKSIRLHPAVTMFMRFGTWMLTSISPREWVAVHRKHHNFSDVDGDPHSPHIEGYWQIMIGNVYYYRREANNDNTLEKYAADLPFDRLDRLFLRRGTLEQLAMSLARESLWVNGCLLGRSQTEDSGSLTTATHEQERGCPRFLCEPLLGQTLRQGGA